MFHHDTQHLLMMIYSGLYYFIILFYYWVYNNNMGSGYNTSLTMCFIKLLQIFFLCCSACVRFCLWDSSFFLFHRFMANMNAIPNTFIWFTVLIIDINNIIHTVIYSCWNWSGFLSALFITFMFCIWWNWLHIYKWFFYISLLLCI